MTKHPTLRAAGWCSIPTGSRLTGKLDKAGEPIVRRTFHEIAAGAYFRCTSAKAKPLLEAREASAVDLTADSPLSLLLDAVAEAPTRPEAALRGYGAGFPTWWVRPGRNYHLEPGPAPGGLFTPPWAVSFRGPDEIAAHWRKRPEATPAFSFRNENGQRFSYAWLEGALLPVPDITSTERT